MLSLVLQTNSPNARCGSRAGFSAADPVLWRVTVSSVLVTSCTCHVSLGVELTTHPCISSQFNLLVFPGGYDVRGRLQSCSSLFLELLWMGTFVRWHLVSIRAAAPAELFPLQQWLWLWLCCAFWGHIICYIDQLAMWGQSSCSELWVTISTNASAKWSFQDEGGTWKPSAVKCY